jgi:hypothetical protein
MSGELIERDLAFDVRKVFRPDHFDHQSHGLDAFKKVDFVFEWPEEIWLVEVKDADDPEGRDLNDPSRRSERQEAFIDQFKSGTLIDRNLGPKVRDSFLYLLLERRLPEGKEIRYIVLFACAGLSPKALLTATKKLKKSAGLLGPHGQGWRSGYLKDCVILDLEGWNRQLGDRVPVTRLSAS